ALKDAELRDYLVEGSFAKNEIFRYNSARVIYRAIQVGPELFYPYWDRFAGMIDSPNGFHRSVAAQVIALLAAADKDRKLDPIFAHYLDLLNDPKVMVTHYFLEAIGKIYRARPDLQKEIMACLLNMDKTGHLPERRDMLKADIISVFDQLFDSFSPQDQKKASTFVKKQLESSSLKTRKAAKEFEKKHPWIARLLKNKPCKSTKLVLSAVKGSVAKSVSRANPQKPRNIKILLQEQHVED
ncbi:MAG: hypothetical protein A2W33_09120, partial [Chloroflexi bacterium RBG_16_52_11]